MNRATIAALAAAVISLGTGNQASAQPSSTPPTDPSCFGQAVSDLAQMHSLSGEIFGKVVSRAARGGTTHGRIPCSPPGAR
jgi:hypothetical protein